MSSERVSVRADLRRKFQSLSGVGPATATKCADAAMEYLDSLVKIHSDGEHVVQRPSEVPFEYQFVMFKTLGGTTKKITNYWITTYRPEKPPSMTTTPRDENIQGLFAYDVDQEDINRQLYSILDKDPDAFYARFSDVE